MRRRGVVALVDISLVVVDHAGGVPGP